MTRAVRIGLIWGLVAAAGACARPVAPAVTATIEAIDVHVTVRPDGGLAVREVLRVVPAGGSLDVSRVVASRRADAIHFRAASVDGQPVGPGRDGFAVEGGATAPLIARWQRDEASAPVWLGFEYDVARAVGVRRPRGELEWPVLPAGRGFAVGVITVTLEVPDGAFIYDGTGMAEAGWTVEVAPGRVTARRDRIGVDEPATLLAVFDVDRSRVQQGQWEWNLDRQDQYRLALIAAGLFILVVGAGILVQLRVQYPPAPAGAPGDVRLSARADRRMVSRGLRLSAVAALIVAGLFAAAAARWLAGLGPALQFIPGSIAIVAMMFLAASWAYGRGAKA